ncbi:hypothetical protein [Aureimonas leprariae]|uniref:Glycosyl transferase family 2 n=1 Tax=Plantimonas leprariae TaxID=2615207 RepID=A0A7V7PSW8_9HYPH|nr:hypothetical protein [Aureimonas leprariae]KAB0682633.1 hypothetical protein F6X38_00635 [Aureimonas leprariae]
MNDLAPRCFVCAARDWLAAGRVLRFEGGERRYALQCSHCGLLADADWSARNAPEHLAAALEEPRFRSDPAAPYGLDVYTLRTAATARRKRLHSLGPEQGQVLRHPHGELPAEAVLEELAASERAKNVALAILCREEEEGAAVAKAAALAPSFVEVIVFVDGPPGPPRTVDGVRVLSRPLDGDFAAQRNAAQDAARVSWVFQLDLDETVGVDILQFLDALAAVADTDGILSVGFRRRNFVDGQRADVYPDIQYRLNRREVRYAGRAHERPDLGGRWQRSFVALTGDIRHDLTRAHVLARSARYEALRPGEGRTHERDDLLRPYRG